MLNLSRKILTRSSVLSQHARFLSASRQRFSAKAEKHGKLPPTLINFLKEIYDQKFFENLVVVCQENSELMANQQTLNPPTWQNKSHTFYIHDSSELENFYNFDHLYETCLEDFYFLYGGEINFENSDNSQNSASQPSKILAKNSTWQKIKNSTPSEFLVPEHLIKLFIYKKMSDLILSAKNQYNLPFEKKLPDSSMLILGGSLGKGLIKENSDIDLILIDSNLERPNESYNYFTDYWQIYGRESSLNFLNIVDKHYKLEKLLSERLVSKYDYLTKPVFPIISFNFAGIDIDIQSGNFTAIDEVSILRVKF